MSLIIAWVFYTIFYNSFTIRIQLADIAKLMIKPMFVA